MSKMSIGYFVFRLTILSMAVMVFIIIENVTYFIQTDHFLEECTSTIYHEEKYLLHYPCLYLDLWKKYNNGNVYDTRHFLNTFFGISTCLAIGYVVSSLCALISICTNSHLGLIPWNLVNSFIVIFLSILIYAEVDLKPPEQFLSKYCVIALCFLIYCCFNFVSGLIILVQIKKRNEKRNKCDQFENLELQSLHTLHTVDNLSWF